jgi:two-component system response regulator CpxR
MLMFRWRRSHARLRSSVLSREPAGSRLTCARVLKGEIQEHMRPKKTILCVDDNEQALSVRKFMLETRGYRVLTATSSEQALEIFREGGIDLVLSDLIMPLMDGNELVRRMKELAPEVPAILISGSVKAFDRANRADAFLPKGACSPVEMLERIRVMVARKRGPKKGHSLRPLLSEPIEERESQAHESVVVGA